MRLETVKVVREDSEKGYRVINKDDFDPKVHKLFGESKSPAPKKRGRPRKKQEAN